MILYNIKYQLMQRCVDLCFHCQKICLNNRKWYEREWDLMRKREEILMCETFSNLNHFMSRDDF